MFTPTRVRAGVLLAGLGCLGALAGSAHAQPQPPLTDRFSVQMYQGATQNCWIAVWPPAANADGTPIAFGTPVKIKVYRSYDAGKTYKADGVTIVGTADTGTDGTGVVGQGELNPQEKDWIDLKLQTPVDNQPPYAVWLAVTAVINGKESAPANTYLTFRYRGPQTGNPTLIRYQTPDINGEAVAEDVARPLPQELPGKWGNGLFTIRSVLVTPGMRDRIKSGQVEGCDASTIDTVEKMKGASLAMEINIKTIDLVQAPGLGGVPVGPAGLTKLDFPGTLTYTITDPKNPQPPQEGAPIGFNYRYFNPRDPNSGFISFQQAQKPTTMSFGGHFFQNDTEYIIFGTWRILVTDDKAPGQYADIKGTWTVKRKPK